METPQGPPGKRRKGHRGTLQGLFLPQANGGAADYLAGGDQEKNAGIHPVMPGGRSPDSAVTVASNISSQLWCCDESGVEANVNTLSIPNTLLPSLPHSHH